MPRARRSKKPDHLNLILAALEAQDEARVRAVLAPLHPADIARVLEGLSPENRPTVWHHVTVEQVGEVLLELPEAVRADLVPLLDDDTVVAAVRALDVDEIADLLPEFSDQIIAEVLFALDKQDRQRLDAVLSYPEDTAGGLMNIDAVTVRENITIDVVLRYLRRRGELPENTDNLFVVDRNDRLVGTLHVTKLLTASASTRVAQVMEREVVKFLALAPDRDVARAFEGYDLVSAPVVDAANRLLGRITIDDVVDVIRAQADRQVLAPAGLSEDEDIFAPVTRTTRKRALWLGINLVTAFVAAAVVGLFEESIEKVAVLAVMLPIVAGMGGNAGTQTLTVVVRGLAVGVITEANARRVLVKELLVGALNGLLWAVTVAAVILIWYQHYLVALALALSMVINLIFAAFSGVLIPVAVRRLGVDPAVASGVILTTITDVVGFFAFLGLATWFLL
ncbi:MAG: magnesium transporter [Pseudomonadota bacterium]|nr:MAG: magnesium transporter [Pseudomonadota bacterium]